MFAAKVGGHITSAPPFDQLLSQRLCGNMELNNLTSLEFNLARLIGNTNPFAG
jgi:hypothetical protein